MWHTRRVFVQAQRRVEVIACHPRAHWGGCRFSIAKAVVAAVEIAGAAVGTVIKEVSVADRLSRVSSCYGYVRDARRVFVVAFRSALSDAGHFRASVSASFRVAVTVVTPIVVSQAPRLAVQEKAAAVAQRRAGGSSRVCGDE